MILSDLNPLEEGEVNHPVQTLFLELARQLFLMKQLPPVADRALTR